MLKWLLHRAPDPSLPDLITDDPLATLDFGQKKKKKGDAASGIGLREIYSVSRLEICDVILNLKRDVIVNDVTLEWTLWGPWCRCVTSLRSDPLSLLLRFKKCTSYTGFPRYMQEIGTEKNMLANNKIAYKKVRFQIKWPILSRTYAKSQIKRPHITRDPCTCLALNIQP